MLQWPQTEPAVPETTAANLVTTRAQIRTKRFAGHTGADEDRFTATIEARSSSPLELLQALMKAMESSDEMRKVGTAGEPLILEIKLVAG